MIAPLVQLEALAHLRLSLIMGWACNPLHRVPVESKSHLHLCISSSQAALSSHDLSLDQTSDDEHQRQDGRQRFNLTWTTTDEGSHRTDDEVNDGEGALEGFGQAEDGRFSSREWLS